MHVFVGCNSVVSEFMGGGGGMVDQKFCSVKWLCCDLFCYRLYVIILIEPIFYVKTYISFVTMMPGFNDLEICFII